MTTTLPNPAADRQAAGQTGSPDVVLWQLPHEDNGNYLCGPEQLVQRFLITKRSPHTRFNYGLDLGVRQPRPGADPGNPPKPGPARGVSWLDFCYAVGLDPLSEVHEEHVALWARSMEAAGLSSATVARKLAAVSSWYSWMARNGHHDGNPAENLDRPYVDPDTSKTPGMTKTQTLALLKAADVTPRNSALTAALIFTGARVSEICGADLADLGMDRGHRVLWVTRKAGARQPLVLPPPAVQRLDTYIETRRDVEHLPAITIGGGGKPLIASAAGKRMRPADVWQLMRRLGKAAGLPPELVRHMGVHSMRHSFATLYLDAGGNLRDLQDAMGHKDPRTTRRYDRARNNLDRSPGYTLATYLAEES